MNVSYNEVLANVWLMARTLFKVSWMTGLGPGIVLAIAAKQLAWFAEKRGRQPKGRLIEFPGTAGGARPRSARIAN